MNETKTEKAEVMGINEIVPLLKNPRYLEDPECVESLVAEINKLLITKNTVTEVGCDLVEMKNIISELLSPFRDLYNIDFLGDKDIPDILITTRGLENEANELRQRYKFFNKLTRAKPFRIADIYMTAHYDTVPFSGNLGTNTPYEDENCDIYGRGAIDDKGQLASIIVLLAKLYFHYKDNYESEELPSIAIIIPSKEEKIYSLNNAIGEAYGEVNIDYESTGELSGVYSTGILADRYAVINTNDKYFEMNTLNKVKETIELTTGIECHLFFQDKEIRICFATPENRDLTSEENLQISRIIKDYLPRFTFDLKINYERPEVKWQVDQEVSQRMNMAMQRNYPLGNYPAKNMATIVTPATNTDREVKHRYNFLSTFTAKLKVMHNTMVIGYPDGGRHSKKEVYRREHGYPLVQSVFDFVINYYRPIES